MTGASNDKRDFFISFNQADRAWATWIAWVLEEAKYSVWFQDWDFRRNFVEHMDEAHRKSAWTIAVLSDNYFGSEFTLLEWSARVAREPKRLISVRVGALSEDHILDAMLYADLMGCDEAAAELRLLGHIRKWIDPTHRPKPETRPGFPGAPARQVPQKPRFPVASHNLPPPNPDFVGREEILAELHRLLTGGQGPAVINQTITGLGGIGKTQTALTYAYRHLAEYRLVWWLRAESTATLAADFATLAEPLGLDPATAEQDKLFKEIRRALQASDDWLLILDNVEDPKLPRTYLPTTGSGHVLITSRRTDWHKIARTLPLEVMDETEALQLLTGWQDPDALPPADLAEAKALARDLGYLPLALAQARAYILETGRSLESYRKLLNDARPRVLNRPRAPASDRENLDYSETDYPTSVAKTWQISIDAAAREQLAAQSLLELLAFFAPDALPVAVLAAEPAILPKGLRDEFERDSAIAALHRFSLIHTQAGSITVHRLVQAVTRDGLDEPTAAARAETAMWLVNAALPNQPKNPTNWPAVGVILPHTLTVAKAAERLGVDLGLVARVLNDIAIYYDTAHAAFAEAAPLLQRALAIRETVLGPEHPDTADSLASLAILYQAQGRLAEAAPLLQRALAIHETVLGPEHPNTADSLDSLAALYHYQDRLAEAEPLFQRALAITEKVLGPEHPDTARSLANLAALYYAQEQLSEAVPLLQRALAIFETVLGAEHPTTARSLANLATLYQAQGRYDEAAPLFQRALAISETVLGAEHPDTARSLASLATLYQAQGRYDEAAPLYQRALAIFETVLGPEHPDTADSLANLATLYRVQGRLGEAAPLYQRALAIREKVLGPDHPGTALSLNNLASLYRVQGRYDEAAPLYQRALAISDKVLGAEHPDTALSLNNLASLYRAQGRLGEAAPLYQRALAIREKVLGAEHPDTARSLTSLATLYQAQGRLAEAAPLFQRALAISETVLGAEHPDTARSLTSLAILYQAQGRLAEAAPLYQRALAISETVLGPEHPHTCIVRKSLATLRQRQPLFHRIISYLQRALL